MFYIKPLCLICRILKIINQIQNLYDSKQAMMKILPHLATRNEEVAKEVLGFLCVMLFNANHSVQVGGGFGNHCKVRSNLVWTSCCVFYFTSTRKKFVCQSLQCYIGPASCMSFSNFRCTKHFCTFYKIYTKTNWCFCFFSQQSMLEYFLSTREEVFFMAVRDRMALSTNTIKEKYVLLVLLRYLRFVDYNSCSL